MPDRVLPARDPGRPGPSDRALAHIFELIVLHGVAVMGLLLVAQALVPDFNPAPSIADLRDDLAGLLGLPMVVGCAFWVSAIVRNYEYLDQMFLRLRVGTALVAIGAFCYAFVACSMRPAAPIPYALGGSVAVAAAAQFAVSFLAQKCAGQYRKERANASS